MKAKLNTVKITSGKFARRELKTPGAGTHPMGARERLALFNQIAGVLPGARVLDAFAGSGALGIEAASRGAAEVIFVEKAPAAARVIRENLAVVEDANSVSGATESAKINATVIVGDVVNFTTDQKFDVILADPPYDNFKITEVESLVRFLAAGGTLVLSHSGEAPDLAGLELKSTRKYAGARISVYRG